MTDHDDSGREPTDDVPAEQDVDEDEESLIDELRGSGVGVEDPNIVGASGETLADEQVARDEPPKV